MCILYSKQVLKCVFVKVAFSFAINKFPKHNISRNKHTYIMINASYEGICVDF